MNASEAVILIVEDEPLIARLVCEVLEAEGHRCLVADNASKALDLLETLIPALITLDLGLPGVGGRTLLRIIRAREVTRATPVVIISADYRIEPQVRDLSQAVITKPFELRLLVETVQRLLK